MTDKTKNKYDVGFGKPPEAGQFKKGQSGNPKGRPKGTPDFKTIIRKMLSTQVTITEGGKKKRVSTLTATLMRLNEKSLKGDMRAIEKVLSLAVEMAAELESRKEGRTLSARDSEVMERFRQSILSSGASAPSKEDEADAE